MCEVAANGLLESAAVGMIMALTTHIGQHPCFLHLGYLFAERAMQTWIIGSGAQCDLVVSSPGVSGRHCRLTSAPDGYILEDLGSTNGTYVNGMRISTNCRVARSDTITLGLSAPLPWPPEPASSRSVILTVGREPDNDFVINLPMVSGHHARVLWNGDPGVATIEDLGSANGTAVGSPDRKITHATFTASDTIYLGSYAVPAAQILARIEQSSAPAVAFRGAKMVIGRDPSCDKVIDLPMVSGRHALLARRDNQVLIKDLGSSNGTFVNGQRINGEIAVNNGDLIGLGSHTLVLAIEPPTALQPTIPIPAHEPASSAAIPTTSTASVSRPDVTLSRDLGDALVPPWRLAALFLQAPLLALAIVAIFRVPQVVPSDPDSVKAATAAVTAILSGVSLAALWFGLSNAVLGNLLDRDGIRSGLSASGAGELIARLAVLIVVGGLQCTLVWLIAASIAGLQAPAASAIGLLTLASAVGVALGLLIVCVVPVRTAVWISLGVVIVLLGLLGSPSLQLWRSGAGIVANASPSRWAFEGLLLLESDRRAQPISTESNGALTSDLAETLFPAASERMGTRADALALTFMFIGLAAGAAFISTAPKLGP
jgi:pSer/pThr/pTyr-binding forkhead associated (FHA) protein